MTMKRMLATALALSLLLFALPAFAEGDSDTSFGAFEAENLRGDEPITEAYFAGAELTLVNYWATWCPPCRAELPDLAKLGELSGGRAQVLGVLTDSIVDANFTKDEGAIEAAHALLDDAGATFPVVVPDLWLLQISSVVTSIPTTFLVDREGNVVSAVLGARSAEEWMSVVEETLGAAK